MKRTYLILSLFLIIIFLSGCETTQVTKYVCSDKSIVNDVKDCPKVESKTETRTITNEVMKYQCSDGSYVDNKLECPTPETKTTTPQTTTPAVEEQSDKAIMGEKNALSKALSYLRYTSFSYSGLVKQLEYEGYTHQEAVYGVDNCGANWNKQAALKAQSYLDYSAFSREGLIEQLEYEGFTREQAEYGVQAAGY